MGRQRFQKTSEMAERNPKPLIGDLELSSILGIRGNPACLDEVILRFFKLRRTNLIQRNVDGLMLMAVSRRCTGLCDNGNSSRRLMFPPEMK